MAAIVPTDIVSAPSTTANATHDHGGAELLFNALALTGAPTGPGNALGITARANFPILSNYTWVGTLSGGTLTSITLNLEGSLDGTTWFLLDQSTNAGGEARHVANKPIRYVRANVNAVVVNAGSPLLTVIFGA